MAASVWSESAAAACAGGATAVAGCRAGAAAAGATDTQESAATANMARKKLHLESFITHLTENFVGRFTSAPPFHHARAAEESAACPWTFPSSELPFR